MAASDQTSLLFPLHSSSLVFAISFFSRRSITEPDRDPVRATISRYLVRDREKSVGLVEEVISSRRTFSLLISKIILRWKYPCIPAGT